MDDYFAKKATIDDLINRFDAAKNVAEPWQQEYAEVYKYTQPSRNSFTYSSSQPTHSMTYSVGNIQDQATHREVYDSTAIKGCKSLVAKLISYLIPPYTEWQKFEAGPEMDQYNKANFLGQAQKLTSLFFRFLNESNFYIAATEMFFDGIVGTFALNITKGPSIEKPLNFRAVPISQLYIEECTDGTIRNVFRERIDVLARDIEYIWPKAKISSETMNALSQDPQYKVDIREMTIYLEGLKKYRYIVFEKGTKHILIDEMSDSSPWVVFPWSKAPGDPWGTGPAMDVISDVKTLNAIVEDQIRTGAIRANPMWMVTSDGIFNANDFLPQPGAIWPINSLGATSMPIKAVDVGGDVQYNQAMADQLRAHIQQALYVDLVRPNDASPLSATEVMYKKEVVLQEIQPVVPRLQQHFLPVLTDRIIYLLKDWGLFPNIKIDGKNVRLTYTSPLAQGQNNAEIQRLLQLVQIVQQTAGPQAALGAINLPELPQWLAEKIGVNMDLVKSAAEIQQALQEAQQQAQAQEQAAGGLPTPPAVPQQEAVGF